MSVLEDKARLIAEDLVQHQGIPEGIAAAGDFLGWVLDIFKELLPTLIGCFASTEKAVQAINDPNWFQQFQLRLFLRKQMRDNSMERKMLMPLYRSMLKLGKTITKDEYVQMQIAV